MRFQYRYRSTYVPRTIGPPKRVKVRMICRAHACNKKFWVKGLAYEDAVGKCPRCGAIYEVSIPHYKDLRQFL
jgi:phage FluMu protein Com